MELLRRLNILEQLGRIESPTLVSVGTLDPVTPVAAAAEIVDALPDGIAQLAVVEEAGHFTWMDARDQYWPTLIDFVISATELRAK
jgi:pimeloyl-ACP methyl ester carboxylesterase